MKLCPFCHAPDQDVTKVYQPKRNGVTIRYYDCPACKRHYKTEERQLREVRRRKKVA